MKDILKGVLALGSACAIFAYAGAKKLLKILIIIFAGLIALIVGRKVANAK